MSRNKSFKSIKGQDMLEDACESGTSSMAGGEPEIIARPGFFMRLLSWIANGSSRALKTGDFCRS